MEIDRADYPLTALLGVEIRLHGDKPGQWVAVSNKNYDVEKTPDGSEYTHDSEKEAYRATELDIASIIMGSENLSSEDWDGMSEEQQEELAREVFELPERQAETLGLR